MSILSIRKKLPLVLKYIGLLFLLLFVFTSEGTLRIHIEQEHACAYRLFAEFVNELQNM